MGMFDAFEKMKTEIKDKRYQVHVDYFRYHIFEFCVFLFCIIHSANPFFSSCLVFSRLK